MDRERVSECCVHGWGQIQCVYVYSPPVRCVCTYIIRVYSCFLFIPFFFAVFFCKFVLGQFILPAIWFANVEMCEIKVENGFFVYDRIDTVIFFRISQ